MSTSIYFKLYFYYCLTLIQNIIINCFQLKKTIRMAFFETGKRGQMSELHDGLNSKNFEDKKIALKKVIAQMTLGKDLSPLFQSVLKCLEYPQLDMKKLVYLYIINYSRSKPDDAIMTISCFRKDAANKTNPIIRALAVRTMSSLRVPKLNQYLVEPLKTALNDDDPYVRKTAVLSIPKVYEIAPNDAQSNNLVNLLEILVTKQSNALVLANAIASLQQIGILTGRNHIKMDSQLLGRILVAINECMQWAQVFILDFLSKYTPKDEKQAQMVIDRIIPRLSHINPAVVFGSIRLIVRYLDFLTNQDLIKNLIKKLAPSIVSIVSFTPVEIQYVVLKNIQYIVEKRPSILQNQIKCFFCKFSDPYYIKNQKIEILIRIINYKNYESVLDELKEYIQQVDSQFVKRCIRAVGKIAIRYQKSVEKCMFILSKAVKQAREAAEHAQQIINQLLSTMQNILRKYPSKYNFDGMFLDLVCLLDHASETESKQAAVWILAEYAEQIYNVSMATFKKWIANFENQERKVQLQILSSAVKVYLKYPDQFQTLISDLLTVATENVSNPDVRDRAFIYWRMLSTDPQKTKTVVFGYRPQAKDNDKLVDKIFLSEIMKSMGYASSMFQKKPEQLFQRSLAQQKGINMDVDDEDVSPPAVVEPVVQTKTVQPVQLAHITQHQHTVKVQKVPEHTIQPQTKHKQEDFDLL